MTAVFLLLFLAGSCRDGVAPPDDTDIAFIQVTPEAVAIFIGDTVRFGAEATLFDGTTLHQPSLTWSTSDPSVAIIDPSGKLTALTSGTVTVRAVSEGVEGVGEAQVNPIGRRDTRLQGSPEFPHQEEPHLVVDEAGNLHAAWKEMTENGAQRVANTRSSDGGETWSDARLMNPTAPGWLQLFPWLALDGSGTLFFARLEVSLDLDDRRVVVSASRDGGVTWDRTVAVADSAELGKETLYGDGAGFLYAGYAQGPSLRVASSQDGGRTWSPASLLPTSAESPTGPVLAPGQDGKVFAAWWSRPDGNLWVATSSDQGVSWGCLRRLNPEAGSVVFLGGHNRPAYPSIAAGTGGRVTVAWQDFATGDWDILLAHTDDDGETWSQPLRINDSPLGDQFMPALAAGPDGSLHAAWYDSRTAGVNLVYARSTDGGETWSTNIRVTSEETPIFHGRLGDYLGLAVGRDGEAFMVWIDRRDGEQNIYFARSSDF